MLTDKWTGPFRCKLVYPCILGRSDKGGLIPERTNNMALKNEIVISVIEISVSLIYRPCSGLLSM